MLADLPRIDPEALESRDASQDTGEADADDHAVDIDAVGRRLEQAHQILVDALESVEKG